MAIKLVICNQKGGVGKTTSSIELAACFSRKKYKVLVVDLEQQYDTTKYSGGDPRLPGIYEVLKGEKKASEVIQETGEYDLISASPALSNADADFSKYTDVFKLKMALSDINDSYDFIIIDTNPGRNRLLNMAYVAADYLIIPTDADDGSLDGIRAVFHDLEEYKSADLSSADVLGVIFTRVERTGMHRYAEEQIEKILSENAPGTFLMKVRKGIAATESKAEGTSMQTGKTYSKPAMDYRKIAEEIIRRVTE